MKPENRSFMPKLKVISAMTIFGTLGVFVHYVPLPSGLIALARGAIGFITLLAFVLITKRNISLSAIKKNLITLIVSGILLGLNWMMFFEAYRYTSVATATLCYYLAPVFVTIASPFIFKERLTPKKLICVLLALFGMVFVSGAFEETFKLSEFTGVLLGVGAAVLYAVIVILNKKLVDISAYDRTISQLAISSIVMLPYVLLTENVASLDFSALSIAILAALGIVHTGLAYTLYFGSLGELPAQTAAIFSYIDPVVAVLLSALLLKEPLSLFSIIGAVLILGSTFISEISFRKKCKIKTQ